MPMGCVFSLSTSTFFGWISPLEFMVHSIHSYSRTTRQSACHRCKSEGNPDPLMTLKAMWMSTLERGPLWRTQDSLLAIRAELPETEITHQNCDRLFVEGFSLLKQRHADLLNISENVSASALSNILTQNKIYSHRKQRLAAIAAVPSTAIRPAAVAATPPAAKRHACHADVASRSVMPPSKHARTI